YTLLPTPSYHFFIPLHIPHPPPSPLFPYTTLFRSKRQDLYRSNRNSSTHRHRLRYPARVHRAIRGAEKIPGTRESDFFCASNRRSEEHTSELQSRSDLVCRLLLEKKKKKTIQEKLK